MNIGSAIKLVRKEKGVKQKDLARLSGISVTALVQIEANNAFPRSDTVKNIATALGVSVAYIVIHCIEDHEIPEHKREVFNAIFSILKRNC